MKIIRTTMMALAIVAGVSGAFVTKAMHGAKVQAPTYNWVRVGGSPISGEVNPLFGKTTSQAQVNYGCSGASAPCAIGTSTVPGQPGALIRLN